MSRSVSSAGLHALSGTAGGVLAMLLLYPLEAVRVHMQVRRSSEDGASRAPSRNQAAWKLARKLVKSQGIGALYRGLNAALVSVGISSGVYFFWYNLFRVMRF
jgi:hypothetical protein